MQRSRTVRSTRCGWTENCSSPSWGRFPWDRKKTEPLEPICEQRSTRRKTTIQRAIGGRIRLMLSRWHWRGKETCWSLNCTDGASTASRPTQRSGGACRARHGSIRNGGHATKKPSLFTTWRRISSSFQEEDMSSGGRPIQANSWRSMFSRVWKGPLSTTTVTRPMNWSPPLMARCIGCKVETFTNASF